MNMGRCADKQILVSPCHGIPLKKKQINDASNCVDESQEHGAEQKKQVEKCLLFMFQYR